MDKMLTVMVVYIVNRSFDYNIVCKLLKEHG